MTSAIRPPDEVANLTTHGIGFLLSLLGATWLMVDVAEKPLPVMAACAIYSVSLLMVYGCSTLSHLFHDIALRQRFRTLDQASIFLLISGTYTPFAIIYWDRSSWRMLLPIMWLVAFGGIWRVLRVRDLSRADKVLFGVMGFLPVVTLVELARVAPMEIVVWIVIGGACYSLGTIFLRLSATVRYSHAIWHLFVMAGSASHYYAIVLAIHTRLN